MALTELTENLNTHQSLPNQPALTADELKALWDEAPNAIKNYINQTLTKELDRILESKVDKVVGKVLSSNDFTNELKTKLNGIANNANNYSHPTNAGNKHIPSGGSSGQILRWSANGTAVWGADNNTTYGVATTSANGLMSSTDKTKLNGIASGATKNTIENVLTSTSTSNGLSANQGRVLNDKYNGKVLYNNTSGTTATITLADSVANYSYVEIFYFDTQSNTYTSTRVYSPNGKGVRLILTGDTYVYNAIVNFNAKTLTWSRNMRVLIADGTRYTDTNTLKIVRVMGYK